MNTAELAWKHRPPASEAGTVRSKILGFPALFAGVVAAFVFMLSTRSMADQDIGWHLRNAQYLLQTSRFVRHDMFAYTTAGAPWINHEWLAEIPFYLAWKAFGERGLYGVTLLLLEAIFLGVYLLSYRHSKDEKAACIVTIAGAMLGTVSFGPRTLLFGWLLLVAELLILQHYTSHRAAQGSDLPTGRGRLLWLLPPIFLVWVNVHGSWLIGLMLLLLFVVCGSVQVHRGRLQQDAWHTRERTCLLTILAACLAALFVNPYGWHLVAYPFDLAFRQKLNIANVEEWQSLDFRTLRARILLIACGASLLRQLVRTRIWSPYEVALAGIGLYAAMSYTRFLFLAAIVVMPLLAPDFAGNKTAAATESKPALNAITWIVLVLCCCLICRYRSGAMEQAAASGSPQNVLSHLSSLPPSARIFNSYDWGGFLEWHLPALPVFIDSRVDIFERAGVFADYLDVVQLRDSLSILDRYKINYVVFQNNTPLVYVLRRSSSWKVDYEDKATILLEHVAMQ